MSKESTLVLNKILTCLYLVILLLVINTALALLNGSTNTNTTENTEVTTEEPSEYDATDFDSIDSTEFMELFNGSDTYVVYLGHAGCGYCTKFLPVMKEAQNNFDFVTKYVDIANVSTEATDYTNMITKINDMTEYYNSQVTEANQAESIYGITPTVLIIKDGAIKDVWIGYSEYASYATFLEENEV